MAKSESPKLTLKSIAEKMGALDREVKYMLNKARITPPKKKVVDTESADKKEGEEESDKNKTSSDESTGETPEEDNKSKDEPKADAKDETISDESIKLEKLEPSIEVKDNLEDIKQHSDDSRGQTADDHTEL